jgi:site-specific DNA-methyltransferase (cytosine-N4-specific)
VIAESLTPYDLFTYRPWAILTGHVIDMLKQVQTGSVQCCVTSPPYWGQRYYGTHPQMWGGSKACQHNYQSMPGKIITGGTGPASAKQLTNVGGQYGNAWREAGVAPTKNARQGSTEVDKHPALVAETTKHHGGYVCLWCGAFYGELGAESTPESYVRHLALVFDEVYRVLAEDGVLWLNMGDVYTEGHLAGVPWRTVFALEDHDWILRSDCIWDKPNAMPESVRTRPSKSHEYMFMFSKSKRYYYDAVRVAELTADGKGYRNLRSVWRVNTKPFKGAHFATFPPKLIEPCILSSSRVNDVVLDPFMGSGTTGHVSMVWRRRFLGIELNPEYAKMAEERLAPWS